ncbi:MAG: hypothetical protein U9N87_14540 [Planctomycetota bacterium]|nr:hypothetical protein [Planctomycetota bacterium]
MKKKLSPAYQLLRHVWQHSLKATGHSWERLNCSMRGAMQLAIDAGLRFDRDDFAKTMKEFRGGYWFGETGGEYFYALAVQTGNLSAAQAFESWKERQPFIADVVDTGSGRRKRGRLAVGSRFPWRGFHVTVTSFALNGAHLTACAYKDDAERKVAKRFRITIADIRADRKERNERIQLHKQLIKMDNEEEGVLKTFSRRAGLTCQADWDQMPPEKIRALIEALEKDRKQAA